MPGELPHHSEDLPPEEPKRESGISKVVGFDPEEEKTILAKAKEVFEDQIGKALEHDSGTKIPEKEKTEEDREMIRHILLKIPDFIKKYGGIPMKITENHVHMLNKDDLPDELKKEKEERGGYVLWHQFLYVFDDKNNIANAKTIVHELIHFNAFQSLDKNIKGGPKPRRSGFQIAGYGEDENLKTLYFDDINEAVTEELARRFSEEYFPLIPQLRKDVQYKEEFIKKYKTKNAKEISWIETKQLESGKWRTTIAGYSYKEQRRELRKIIKEIYEKNPEEFNSREEVFTIFAEAAMSGKLLKIGRLIEKTYGKGSFRGLAEKTKEEVK